MNFLPEEFALSDKSGVDSAYAETFIYTPATTAELKLGNLYIIGEISSHKAKKENARLLGELAGAIKTEYYKNTSALPLSAIRLALKKANNFLAERKIPSAENFLKIKMAAAVIKNNDLHIASLGDATALMLRNNILQYIFSDYPPTKTVIALAQQEPQIPEKNNNHKKIRPSPITPATIATASFKNIISGKLFSEDRILIATNQIHRVEEEKLIEHLADNSLNQYLAETKNGFKSIALIALYPQTDNSPAAHLTDQINSRYQASRKTKLTFYENSASHNHQATVVGTGQTDKTPLETDNNRRELPQKSHKHRALILLIVTVVCVSLITFVAFKLKQQSAANRMEAETLVSELGELKEKTDSLMELGNETEAAEILATAQNKLDQLGKLNYFKTTRSTLAEDFGKISKTLLRLEPIDNARIVFNLENNSADFTPAGLALGKDKVIVFSANTIYKFDLNRNQGSFDMLGDNTNLISILEPPTDPNKLLLLNNDKISLYSGPSDNQIIWQAENSLALKQLAAYSDALYLLGQNDLIYKMPFELTGATSTVNLTSAPILWTKEKPKYSIFNIAVDGFVYAVSPEHSLIKLSNGSQQARVEIKESISQVFTTPEFKNIYLFSPAEGLILVMEKNNFSSGKIKKRLGHPELKDAKSFYINASERVIYFLKGKTVYSFEI